MAETMQEQFQPLADKLIPALMNITYVTIAVRLPLVAFCLDFNPSVGVLFLILAGNEREQRLGDQACPRSHPCHHCALLCLDRHDLQARRPSTSLRRVLWTTSTPEGPELPQPLPLRL